MYNQKLEHKVISEIRNDSPSFRIGIRFNDYFTEDTYVLISENAQNSKKIECSLLRNGIKIGECIMEDRDTSRLLDDALVFVDDYDMKKLFSDDIKKNIVQEISKLMSYYDQQVLLNEVNLEGELRRMKAVAGMKII